MTWEVFRLKIFDCKFDAGLPDFNIAFDGFIEFATKLGFHVWTVGKKLEFFGGFKIKTETFGDLMRKAATANGEHLSSLDAAIFDDGNIRSTTANIHHDC